MGASEPLVHHTACSHNTDRNFNMELARLTEAGYPPSLLRCVAEALLRSEGNPVAKGKREKVRKAVIIPFIHGTSHTLKMVV